VAWQEFSLAFIIVELLTHNVEDIWIGFHDQDTDTTAASVTKLLIRYINGWRDVRFENLAESGSIIMFSSYVATLTVSEANDEMAILARSFSFGVGK